jgi:molecular chaperone DnaJ
VSSVDDLYVVLEVLRTASVDDIKKAFRKLARRYHPDINPGDAAAEEHFKRISDAYDVLSDPLKREFYDRNGFYSDGVLEQPESQTTWGFSFRAFDIGGPASSQRGQAFSQFFSNRIARRDPERGQDLEYQIAMSFSDSMSGIKTRISIQRRHPCSSCQGTGRASAQNSLACAVCNGTGNVSRTRGRLRFVSPCTECSGTGRVVTDCPDCEQGRSMRTDLIEVTIPAGVGTGSRVRFSGAGDSGKYGGPAGDLYVITNVSPHPFFTRAGDNLQCVAPVTFVEAALGTKIEVPTVDGKAVVRIPPGTQTGQVLRLRGKGAPSLLQPGMRGDLFVQILVRVPRIADERSKAILREFAQLNVEDVRKDILK